MAHYYSCTQFPPQKDYYTQRVVVGGVMVPEKKEPEARAKVETMYRSKV
jgi:hypothetical protein